MAGWMHGEGAGILRRTTARMNGNEYVGILREATLPSIRETFGIPENLAEVYLMQDNSPIHTSLLVRQYLRTQEDINCIRMPALSPDLNPIENLWARLFADCPQQAIVSEDVLWGFCQARWELLGQNQQLFRNLTQSMKRRLESVLEAGGSHTKY